MINIIKKITTLLVLNIFICCSLSGQSAIAFAERSTLSPQLHIGTQPLQDAVKGFTQDKAAQLLSTERSLFNDVQKNLGKSRICDLPGRQRYVEDLVAKVASGSVVQVAHLSVQNFKQEFNDRGARLDEIASEHSEGQKVSVAGHYFGDFGIQAIAEMLPEMLENEFAGTGITFSVYNDAKSYWVIIEDAPIYFAFEKVLSNMLQSNSVFKQNVVAEVNLRTRARIGLADIPQKAKDVLIEELEKFGTDNFNMYGGVSLASNVLLSVEPKAGTSVDSANALDLQAMLEAKYQQIGLGGGRLKEVVDSYKDPKTFVINKEGLRNELIGFMDFARTAPVSRIAKYSYITQVDANMHRRYGQANEWESVYSPIPNIYNPQATDEKLIEEYEKAITLGDARSIAVAKENIFTKMTVYYLDADVATRTDGPIYYGNENFKTMINFFLLNRPQQNWTGTFRIGGDELGKLAWNGKTAELSIYRFDINNLGKTNFQWGMRVGDKLIDEMLRLIDQLHNDTQYMRDIYLFFNNKDNSTGLIFRFALGIK